MNPEGGQMNPNYLKFGEEIDLEQNERRLVGADRQLVGSGRLASSIKVVSDPVGSKEEFRSSLLEMNFSQHFVEAVLKDIDEGDSREKILFKYFIKGENGHWEHSFKQGPLISNHGELKCLYCGENAENHVNHVACSVCYSPSSPLAKLECGHQFCIKCIENYLKYILESGKLAHIHCLEESCEIPLSAQDIQLLSDKKLTEKIIKMQQTQLINIDPELKWCPGPSCSAYYRITGESKKASVFVCTECNTRMCTKCGRAEHKRKWLFFKKSCEEDVNEEYERWAKGKAVQNCPQCGTRVEKDEGCNHMTCFVCNYNWCWLCRGRYSQNHYSQMNVFGCPGLGSANNTMELYPKWKIYLLRIGMGLLVILIILAIITLGPLIVIVFVTKSLSNCIMKALHIPHDFSRARGSNKCLKYAWLIFINLIFILLCLPFGLVLAVLVLPFLPFSQKIRRSELLSVSNQEPEEKVFFVATEEITYIDNKEKNDDGTFKQKKKKMKLIVPALRKTSESSITRRRTDPSFKKDSFLSNIDSPATRR